jgi:tRNA A-37 threonylcarbamoyl transferase component Bud32
MTEARSDLDAQLSAAAAPQDAPDEARRRALLKARLFGRGEPLYIGRFRIERRLGAGAMGTVYAARDERLDRRVAIKVLRPTSEADRSAARLLQEARGLAQVTHPHVVAVYEVAEVDDQRFIAMEFVAGPTLATWQQGRPWRDVLRAYLDAGRGLHAVHAAGLVHRDFKAANVLVGDDGRVRVADFGLVRRQQETPGDPATSAALDLRLTTTGGLVGTPAYMAPEQLLGKAAGARADQFAFCASLFEALHGVRPFPGDTVADLLVALGRGPVAVAGPVPSAVRRVMQRGLLLDTEARWPDMAALVAALEGAARRRRWPWIAAVGLALGATALLRPTPTPPPDERPVQEARARLEHDPTMAALLLLAADPAAPGQAEVALGLAGRPLMQRRTTLPPGEVRRLYVGRDGAVLVERIQLPAVMVWDGPPRVLPASLSQFIGQPRTHDAAGLEALAREAVRCGDATACCQRPEGGLALVEQGAWIEVDAEGQRRPVRQLGPEVADHYQYFLGDCRALYTRDGSMGSLVEWPREGPARTVPETEAALGTALGTHQLAVGLGDGSVLVGPPGEPARRLTGVGGPVRRLAFSADDAWLVATGSERARIWHLETGRARDVPGALSTSHPAFDATGRRLLLGRARGGALLVDLATGHTRVLAQPAEVAAAAFSPDGQVVTAALDGTLSLWAPDAPSDTLLGRHEGRVWSGSLSPDRRRLATAGFDGVARIWDLQGREPPRVLAGHTAKSLYLAVFSPDGQKLMTGAADATARVWGQAGPPLVLPGHGVWAYALAFGPQGQLATGDQLGTIRRWSAEGTLLATHQHLPKTDGSRVHTVAFSPDGRWLLSGSRSGTATLWPTGAGDPIELAGHTARVDVAFEPQGTALTFAADGKIRRFDTTGRLLHTWAHEAPLYGFALSADGRRVAVGTLDQAVGVHDLWGHEPSQIFRDGSASAEAHAFDASGRFLASGSDDGQIIVRDLLGAIPPRRLEAHQGPVRFVGFAADGSLVSAGTDGTVRRWPLHDDLATIRRRLRASTPLCLSADQRMTWLGERPDIAALLASTCPPTL